LRDIAQIATGNTPPPRDAENYGGEFMFVSPTDLGFSKHIFRTEKMLSEKGFSISRPFPEGSILFVCIGSTIGKCGIAPESLTSNQQINAIMPSSGYSTDYLYYAVSMVADKIKSLAGEQAVPIVNKTQFSETEIALPPTQSEQTAIATILSDMDAEIAALETRLAKTRALKQGMMHNLLTGKIRLLGQTMAVDLSQ
jgi:type I restriction enzyme, S subunit